MHFHADHALFFDRRQPLWRVGGSIILAVAVLSVNAGAGSATVSVGAAAVGLVLLGVARLRGHSRLEPAVAWTLSLVVLAVVGGFLLRWDPSVALELGSRILCGVIWVLWLGTEVDWAALRRLLIWLRLPEAVVAPLDHALMHGVLTKQEWSRRRDAARLRLGRARLPLSVWGPLLGEGALHAMTRLEQVEENAMLRNATASSASPDGSGVLELRGVSVERGGRKVLEDVSLAIEPAEWLLVCGPSGAGKSSLLRLLAGLDGPASGSLRRFANDFSSASTLHERLDGGVALLCQNPTEHFIASTVEEDIVWGIRRREVDPAEADRRVKDVAEGLGIDHLLSRPCHELSFGEQRRVALAGLLVMEPALLLLDEPTSGLDPVNAAELRRLIAAAVRRTNAACVWATHDLHSLPGPARRIALLREGRIIFDGPVAEGMSDAWLRRSGLAVEPADAHDEDA